MAVQLPNFLNVPIREPDYSALGNVFENYYKGKDLPRQDIVNEYIAKGAPLDYLMKQVQAEHSRPMAEQALKAALLGNKIKQAEADYALPKEEQALLGSKLQNALRQVNVDYARPTAEQTLSGLRLGNQSTSLSNRQAEINLKKLQDDMAREAEFNAMLRNSLTPSGMNAETVRQQQNNAALGQALTGVMEHPAMKNQIAPTMVPQMAGHPAEASGGEIQEIDRGTPAHYKLDQLWEDKPEMRPFLVSRDYGKEVKETFDKRTGETRVVTKWPSKRITVKTIRPKLEEDLSNEIPLTKPGLAKVENEVRGIDSLIPYMDSLIEMSKPTKVVEGVNKTKLPLINLMPSNAGVAYRSQINKALESYMSSATLPRTNESIEKVGSILTRGHGEDDLTYHKRLIADRKEMIEKRDKNIKMLKKGLNKLGPNATDLSGYSSQQLKDMYHEE